MCVCVCGERERAIVYLIKIALRDGTDTIQHACVECQWNQLHWLGVIARYLNPTAAHGVKAVHVATTGSRGGGSKTRQKHLLDTALNARVGGSHDPQTTQQ
jgi:hypothetical protein